MITEFVLTAFAAAQNGLSDLKERLQDESGVSATEYMVILGIIIVAVVAIFLVFGKEITRIGDKVTGELGKI